MPINRYFSNLRLLHQIKTDFDFLIDRINKPDEDLDFQIRPHNNFNIYYRGNSLAQIKPKTHSQYQISISNKFTWDDKIKDNFFNNDKRFKGKFINNTRIVLDVNDLKSFFQVKYLKKLKTNIRKTAYSDEFVFQQILISDNKRNSESIIIDQQITEKGLNRKRMDLLALKKISGEVDTFKFCIIEVKLGNNTELRNKVKSQIDFYVSHINKNISAYKNCYEKNYEQKVFLGLFSTPAKVNIINNVEGDIVVGWYTGLAEKYIRELKIKYPHIKDPILFKNILK